MTRNIYIMILCFYAIFGCSIQIVASENRLPNEKDLNLIYGVEDSDCSLTVGWGIWPPYQYLSEDNKAKGVQIDLLNKLAEEANCLLKYVQQPFSKNIADIQSGGIDMMADTTITKQRQSFAYFSDPYRHEILLLYVKKEQVAQCKNRSLTEIMSKQFRLGLTRGNIYGPEVDAIQQAERHKKSIVYLKENRDALTYMVNDKIDGFFEDPIVLAYESKKRNLVGQIKSCRIEIYSGDVSLMFSRKTVKQEVVHRFDQALKKVKQ